MNNITCFTDEISRDFETAADVLGEKQIREFDLRNMRTGRVPYISLEEEKEVEKLLSCYDYICFSDMSEVAFAKRIFYMVYCCFNVFDLEDKTGN